MRQGRVAFCNTPCQNDELRNAIRHFDSPAGGLLNAKGAQGRPFHTFPAKFLCIFLGCCYFATVPYERIGGGPVGAAFMAARKRPRFPANLPCIRRALSLPSRGACPLRYPGFCGGGRTWESFLSRRASAAAGAVGRGWAGLTWVGLGLRFLPILTKQHSLHTLFFPCIFFFIYIIRG